MAKTEQLDDEADKPVYGNDRSAARMAAVQALYQMDLAHTDLSEVIAEFASHHFGSHNPDSNVTDADRAFFADLLNGVVAHQRALDPLLDGQLASGWRLKRIDSILRAILRAGVYELSERKDVPARVVINEYIDVARAFFDSDEPKVVNGVLDKLAHKIRSKEFGGGARSA